MYIPALFKNDNIEEVRDFISKNGFGILISQVDSKPWATHIPLELDKNEEGKDVLSGHISKANPQWKNFTDQSQVLVIFQGPHAYVSSSWYNHENVPTWNYVAVHIYGKIKIIEGEQLIRSLSKLVHKYEQSSAKPVSFEGMSQTFMNKEIRGIVGFEIEVTEIQSAAKLSQNRDKADHGNIVNELQKKGDYGSMEIAEEMKKRVKNDSESI